MLESHGVPMDIKWEEFRVGTSIFIPAVSIVEVRRRIRDEVGRLGIKVVMSNVVEHNIQGIRVWRTP